MSKLLIGISGMSCVMAALIALVFAKVYNFIWYTNIWFWVFTVPAIPFGMAVAGIILIILGAMLLAPFVGLNHLDEVFEDE